MLSKLTQSDNPNNELFKGIKAGGKEYFKEKFKDGLQRDREQLDKQIEKNRDHEKDI